MTKEGPSAYPSAASRSRGGRISTSVDARYWGVWAQSIVGKHLRPLVLPQYHVSCVSEVETRLLVSRRTRLASRPRGQRCQTLPVAAGRCRTLSLDDANRRRCQMPCKKKT